MLESGGLLFQHGDVIRFFFFFFFAGNRLKPQRKIHSLLTPSQNSRHWLRSQVVLFHIIALLCI